MCYHAFDVGAAAAAISRQPAFWSPLQEGKSALLQTVPEQAHVVIFVNLWYSTSPSLFSLLSWGNFLFEG